MIEVPTKKSAQDPVDFQWKMKEPNPELEAEMLQRLLVRFGTPEQTAVAAVTKSPEVSLAKVEKAPDGLPQLAFDDPFDRAWRRVGLALDRVGFTVVDRDRQKGMYFVRYVDPDGSPSSKKDESWLSKLAFWKSEDTTRFQEQYRIVVSEKAGKSQVSVQDKNGTPDKSQTAEKMLSLLLNQLR
jgi:outer membrane protein assembly factor BamC